MPGAIYGMCHSKKGIFSHKTDNVPNERGLVARRNPTHTYIYIMQMEKGESPGICSKINVLLSTNCDKKIIIIIHEAYFSISLDIWHGDGGAVGRRRRREIGIAHRTHIYPIYPFSRLNSHVPSQSN